MFFLLVSPPDLWAYFSKKSFPTSFGSKRPTSRRTELPPTFPWTNLQLSSDSALFPSAGTDTWRHNDVVTFRSGIYSRWDSHWCEVDCTDRIFQPWRWKQSVPLTMVTMYQSERRHKPTATAVVTWNLLYILLATCISWPAYWWPTWLTGCTASGKQTNSQTKQPLRLLNAPQYKTSPSFVRSELFLEIPAPMQTAVRSSLTPLCATLSSAWMWRRSFL